MKTKTLTHKFEEILDVMLDLNSVHPGQYGVLKKRLIQAVTDRDRELLDTKAYRDAYQQGDTSNYELLEQYNAQVRERMEETL